ncbi:MAG: hypothetical protein WKF88_05615 [Ferruginibacter sp.]
MKKFSDFGLTPTIQGFSGEKIKIDRILNNQITVLDYKVENSKFDQKSYDKCLHMQIEFSGEKRVVFIGSRPLIETIEQIPKSEFPFTTKIIRENGRFEFT